MQPWYSENTNNDTNSTIVENTSIKNIPNINNIDITRNITTNLSGNIINTNFKDKLSEFSTSDAIVREYAVGTILSLRPKAPTHEKEYSSFNTTVNNDVGDNFGRSLGQQYIDMKTQWLRILLRGGVPNSGVHMCPSRVCVCPVQFIC
eukprot:GHVR01177659.1.p1 GENE.GHVR01177659.1~~GHVR01177659.1.p1  ORF type:complete len:148 (+),score=27.06 GHVR01177659.1:128-571(+)